MRATYGASRRTSARGHQVDVCGAHCHAGEPVEWLQNAWRHRVGDENGRPETVGHGGIQMWAGLDSQTLPSCGAGGNAVDSGIVT